MAEVREVLRGWLDGACLRKIAERAGWAQDRPALREAAQAAGLIRDAGFAAVDDEHGQAWKALALRRPRSVSGWTTACRS